MVVGAVVLSVLWSVGVAAAADDTGGSDDERSTGLTVRVEGGAVTTPTSTPTPTPSRTSTSTGGSTPLGTGSSSASNGSQATIPDAAQAAEALGEDVAEIGGILAVGGLDAIAHPDLTLGNGSVSLDVVVRNLSEATFDCTARFWIDHVFGGTLATVEDVEVLELEPGETRRVQVRVSGLGQHPVLFAHATVTPPSSVGGVEMSPVTREAVVFVAPLLLLLLLGLCGTVAVAWWLATRRLAGPVAQLGV